MSVTLDPVTLEKMDRFGRRRRRLIVTRGFCSAIVSLLVLMFLVSLADWRWVLSDNVRWSLSGLGYLGAALVAWLTCVRLVVRKPDRRDLARRVEVAEPRLRENLLSAVELIDDERAGNRGSSVFRQLVQNRVGRQMSDVSVRALLPLTMLVRWLLAALLVVATCGVLLSIPELPFRQLLTRAMLPGANIDRVSRIHVTILQPAPHSLTLPEEETVAVVVEVSGGRVDDATIEVQTDSGDVSRHAMRPGKPAQFVTNLNTGTESFQYRILAGDAVTRKYAVRVRPRPHVEAFHKTYHFPEYARLADQSVTESHGDLIALKGTVAKLVLEVDQPVSEAAICIDRPGSDETESMPLERLENRRLCVNLPLEEPGIYKVHLVSAATGFENTFSPKYEIKPEPDLIPRVGFVGQPDSNLLLPPNDILTLHAAAEDDLPLVSLEQYVSVNGQAWQKTTLEIEEARRVTASWDWDLLDLDLRTGDQVTTKIVATDRMGNEGESVPLHVVISAPDFDPDRHHVMEDKAEIYDQFAALATSVDQYNAAAKAIVDQIRNGQEKTRLRDQDRASLLDLAGKVRDECDRVFQRIVKTLPQMPAGVEAYELELAGCLVARIQRETMQIPGVFLDAYSTDAAEQADQDLRQVAGAFEKSSDDTEELARRFQQLLEHDILAAIAYDMDALWQHQQQLVAPGTPQTWQRLLRQETVAINQIQALERLISNNLSRLPLTTQRRVSSYVEWARSVRERLEAATESEQQKATLARLAVALVRELKDRQNADLLDSQLPRNLLAARKELNSRAGSLYVPLHQLAHSASEVAEFKKRASESDDSLKSEQLQQAGARSAAQLARLRIPSALQLKSRKKLTQARRDSDAQYAADAGLTSRAVTALLDRFASESPAESEVPGILDRIAAAHATLEAGHDLAGVGALLNNLVTLERWESQRITSRLDHPRQWDAVQTGIEHVSRKLREAHFPKELVARIDRLRWSAPVQETGRRIPPRRYQHEPLISAAYELDALHQELTSVATDIAPIMEEARALIAQYVPTIPEMARQAANHLRDVEQQTTDLADAVEDSRQTNNRPPVSDVQQQQQQASERIEDLVDALIEDANAQDLLTDEGRERARDADDSVALVRDPAAQMNRAMQKARQAEQPADQARQLSEAAEQQERAADALEQVADHFEHLEAGEDVTQSRDALRQAERDMGIGRQMDQQYDPARQLGEMASKSNEQLLKELEAELQQNPAMQDSLSEISQDTLQQAQNSLEHSADQEEAMQRAIERADKTFQNAKQPLAQELRDIAQAATKLNSTLVAQADSAATRGQSQPAHESLRKTQQDLAETATAAKGAQGDSKLADIVQAARAMAQSLENASKDLQESNDLANKAKDQSINDDKEQRAALQREMEEGQKRLIEQERRDAQQRLKVRQQAERRADQLAKNSARTAQSAAKQVDSARRALQRNPDNQSAQRRVEQAQARQTAAQTAAAKAKQESEKAKKETEQAREEAKKADQRKVPSLTAPNPAAEMAGRLAAEAKEVADELAGRAREIAKTPDWAENIHPDPQQMAQAAKQQEDVGQDVSRAGDDVARASRHEQRLGKTPLGQRLGKQAEDIEQVAQGEVAEAQQQLADTAQTPSDQPANGENSSSAAAASHSVAQAEEAITRQAERLGEILNPPAEAAAAQPAQAAGQESPSAQPSAAEAARGEFLARTLDELDRAMAAAAPGPASSDQPGQPTTPSASLPSLTQAAQAQAAGMAQARMMSQMATESQEPTSMALESSQGSALEGQSPEDFTLVPVDRRGGEDWGKLRSKSAEEMTEGRRETVSAEYRQRVQTYFRVIAERARKKK